MTAAPLPASSNIAPEMFAPAVLCESASTATAAHGGSLWRDVWRQLGRNPAAICGLLVIALMLMLCGFGKYFWPMSSSQFDFLQISQLPTWGMRTQVIYPDTGEQQARAVDAIALPADAGLQLVQPANTEAVVLAWSGEKTREQRFRLYRHELQPSGLHDLGLPLAEPKQATYKDQLQLENRRYFYSLATLDKKGEVLHFQTLAVDVAHATPLAQLQKLSLDVDWKIRPDVVVLPAHPLGTDKLGRDILARLIDGGRTSLFIGITAPLLYVLLGAMYGAFAGYRGGMVDAWMMAFADFVIALPFLLFVIILRMMFGIGPGSDGMQALLLALLLLAWPNTARLVRAQVLQLRNLAYVDAARLLGASGFYIIWRHMLPNVLPGILVTLSFAIPSAIFTEAFLSFIGLGVVAPATSWGTMCNDGLSSFLVHPHELLFPALFISLTVLAFNLLGDGLRDALDVRARKVGQ